MASRLTAGAQGPRHPAGIFREERNMATAGGYAGTGNGKPDEKSAGMSGVSMEGKSSFISDISAIRERARKHVGDGAVTPSYGADREVVLRLLNEALATEIVCVLRYRRHYYMASGAVGEAVKKELLQHANEEQAHADAIAERIVQLGGEPDMNPVGLTDRSHSEYAVGGSWSPGTQNPCTCGAARYGSLTVATGPSSMCCVSTISRSERPYSFAR